MQEFFIMLKNVIIFILLAVPGFVAVKTKLFKSEDSNVLSKVVLFVAMPFFIAASTLNIPLTEQMAIKLLIVAGLYSAFTVLLFFLAKIFIKKDDKNALAGLERFSLIFSNNGFIGLPLAEIMFGLDSPIIAYIVVINVINNVALMVVGPYMFTGDKSTISFKGILKSPVLIAFVIAFIINLIGVQPITKESLYYSNFLKAVVTPLAMTILGMKFANVKMSALFTNRKVYYISFLKLLLFPALTIALMLAIKFAVGLDSAIIIAVFIGFGTSTATLTTSIADRCGVGQIESSLYVLGSTLFSVISLPVLYALLCLFI